jgi:hypothetical protein
MTARDSGRSPRLRRSSRDDGHAAPAVSALKEFPMKWAGTKNLGMLCLSIWLIATGALAFVQTPFAHTGLVLAALAIASGVLLLLGR